MNNYKIIISKSFKKDFNKLDANIQNKIKTWINENLINTVEPRKHGKQLKGNLQKYWRYRIEDYRLLVIIEDKTIILYLMYIKHRKAIYKKVTK